MPGTRVSTLKSARVLKPVDRTKRAEQRPANRQNASDRARSKQVGQAKRPSQASRPSHHRVARCSLSQGSSPTATSRANAGSA
jgi:hypothetical protein